MFTQVPEALRQPIPVLDRGYVRLTRVMAEVLGDGDLARVSDLAPTNDARASFAREKQAFDEKDERLISYMGLHEPPHTSPFRGAIIQVEIKAPIIVARQLFKYVVGSDHDERYHDPMLQWNEVSRRYVTQEPEFWVPRVWRRAAEDRKQGSDGDLTERDCAELHRMLDAATKLGLASYHAALRRGACPEQARYLLPYACMYTTWRWTMSLQTLCHVLRERVHRDAQGETREYGLALLSLADQLFPHSRAALAGGVG